MTLQDLLNTIDEFVAFFYLVLLSATIVTTSGKTSKTNNHTGYPETANATYKNNRS